ncbi:hypothetical protein SAMN02745121_06728 [Nannocystis exedens]|uniref:Uncharacterized protein n=1 Tax=Nannocystis exedens TaxID=54 RepID=A0A1I2FNC5_9BACT|nr:hypothetical protein NAEX_07566 [Nannocystis exedens]SFF06319.1 hypothetical protein SAMN02745121_06728 [Nannocystis exedens]
MRGSKAVKEALCSSGMRASNRRAFARPATAGMREFASPEYILQIPLGHYI